ncbi:MAG: Asp-tRNA(Asn)/Glu-tRNA(Gln) amidotransferase subunit GatA [Opitutales bacterium]
MSAEMHLKTAAELSALLEAGETTAAGLMEALITRTEKVDTQVRAFNSRDDADALKQAKASDERRAAGAALGPLDGIPVSIKDVISVKGQALTASSKILSRYVSPYDAHVIERLKAGGAVIWGRLNLDEFAMGSSTENSATHTTRNPWDTERVPGGSSGGSAAAVAAGEVPLTLGSDTGGSIRQPAALCGVVGLKPTYGLVSRYGLAAFASSLDQIGPFARSIEDSALLLQAIAGHDTRDSTSIKTELPDYRAALSEKKGPWTLGVPKEFFIDGLDPEVAQAVRAAVDWYADEGCTIKEISLPHTDLSVPVYYIVATAEASSNLARYDGIRYTRRAEKAASGVDLFFQSRAEGFGEEVKRRIILGTYVLSSGYYDAFYLRAQKVRSLIRADFMKAFDDAGVDAVIGPTSPTPAFKIGEKADNPLQMYLSDIFTISTNLAGLPGLSLPCGFSETPKLPIGLQLIGQPFKEADLLAIAHAYEQAHGWSREKPAV